MILNKTGFDSMNWSGDAQAKQLEQKHYGTSKGDSHSSFVDRVSISIDGRALNALGQVTKGKSGSDLGAKVDMLRDQYNSAGTSGEKAKVLREAQIMIEQEQTQKVGDVVKINIAETKESIEKAVEERIAKERIEKAAEVEHAEKALETQKAAPSDQQNADVGPTIQGAGELTAATSTNPSVVPKSDAAMGSDNEAGLVEESLTIDG